MDNTKEILSSIKALKTKIAGFESAIEILQQHAVDQLISNSEQFTRYCVENYSILECIEQLSETEADETECEEFNLDHPDWFIAIDAALKIKLLRRNVDLESY